jgi:type 1 glutamine amidotransferase
MPLKALLVGGCPAQYHRLEPAIAPITEALESQGLTVTVSGIYHPDGGDAFEGDYSALNAENLRQYDAVALYTTGNERFGADPAAIVRYVEGGGALIGIHNATDSFTDDADYVRLMGGRFRTHPAQLDIITEITDHKHPITLAVGTFTVHDELYLFTDYDPSAVHLLAQTHSYDDNGPVPIAWTREPGTGRLFYLSLVHNPSTMADPNWQRLFRTGAAWVARL